jgi:hypothetical protein
VNPEISARLKSLDIWVMAEGTYYCLFVRDGCLGMVPRSEGFTGFAANGSTGLSLDEGLGYLVWREDKPFFVGQGFEVQAEPEQVIRVRQFTADLQEALGLADA